MSAPAAWTFWIEGIGLWAPGLTDFAALRERLAGRVPTPPAAHPAAARLPANERRRAPDSVRLAVEVADQAVRMSGREAAALACVFASTQGDAAISDYMCATLASAATELSPTRFHNSVHNAAVGYWTIATGCHAPSSAVAAGDASFAAGLLEAASLALAETDAVLLAGYDGVASGPLAAVLHNRQPFGSALVIAARRTPQALARVTLRLGHGLAPSAPPPALAALADGSPAASALPLLAALAGTGGAVTLAAGATLQLALDVEPGA